MKLQHHRMKVAVLLALSFGFNSCKQTTEEVAPQVGSATVIVNILGAAAAIEPLAPGPASAKLASAGQPTGQAVNSEGIQETIVPFDEYIQIVATLVPEGTAVGNGANGSLNRVAAIGPAVKAAATPVQSKLGIGVQYRLLVYDNSNEGLFSAERTYIRGSESDAEPLELDAGKTYTFIAFSINSTAGAMVPPATLSDMGSLASVSLTDLNEANGELMYFKTEMALTHGDNNLDIILKHQFSQISTTIAGDGALIGGNIEAISGVTIKPVRESANLALESGDLSYATVLETGAAVVFPPLGAGTALISSEQPTRIISPATASGVLNIGSITINGLTKRNLTFPDLNITPGVRYNLNLTFQRPCTEVVTLDGGLNYPEGMTGGETIHAPGADYGFVFDLTDLDNSFNMTINGTPLLTNPAGTYHEIQFDGSISGVPRSVGFADGTRWNQNSIPPIYQLAGTEERPIIRVVISPTGDVSMYGSKSNGGNLEPILPIGANTFNHITWNTEVDNEVVISQIRTGPTSLVGAGYGLKITPCP